MGVYFVMILLGAMVALLVNLNEALPKQNFSWRVFFANNWFPSALNIIIGVIIVICEYDDPKPMFEITKLSSFILGATSQFVYKKLCNIMMPEKQTIVGWNNRDTQYTSQKPRRTYHDDCNQEILDP